MGSCLLLSIYSRVMVLEKMNILKIIKSPVTIHFLAFFLLLGLFLGFNYKILSEKYWESGDYALSVIDVIAAKKFEAYTFLTSSQMVFRHPGPILTYWYALCDLLVLGINKHISPVISQAIASAVLNLIFQLISIYIIYKNILVKKLIIPTVIIIFLFLNSIVEYQLAAATPIMISISAFLLMIISSTAIVTTRDFKYLLYFTIAFIFCVQMHGNFIICSVVLLIFILINYIKNRKKYFNKIYLYTSIVALTISIIPIIYDQLYDSGNISAILRYMRNNNDVNIAERINNYLIDVLKFIPTFFIDLIYSKKYKLAMLENGKYLMENSLTVIFWMIYIGVGYISIFHNKCESSFIKYLYIIISLGILIGIYTSMGKLGNGRLYIAQYPLRYLYAFGCAYLILLIFLLDKFIYQKKITSKYTYGGILIFIITSIFIFKDGVNFFNKNLGVTAGYFMIPTYVSTDYRLDKIIESIENSIQDNGIQIIVETDNWPILSGISSILLRKGHHVSMNNSTYSYFFKLPKNSLENKKLINIYVMNSPSNNGVLLYQDKDLYIYKDLKSNDYKNISSKNLDLSNFKSGWSPPEKNYIWALGPKALFAFDLTSISRDLILNVECKTPYGLKREVIVYLNDNFIAKKFIEGENYSYLKIKLPKKYLTIGKKNEILFKFPDAVEMNKIGYQDTRALAIAVSKISVE